MIIFDTVKKANEYINGVILRNRDLIDCEIHGEISEYTRNQRSGHAYFTIKDSECVLPCVMFRDDVDKNSEVNVEPGQAVICRGRIRMYVPNCKVQLEVKKIEPAGEGELLKKLMLLRKKLEAEGVFSPEIKKPIPKFAKKVGIVTSPTGQAIRDIMSEAGRRNPYVQLILYPALVEGDDAPASIVKGIEILDATDVDVIIIGRGGGQKEGQRAFNEESVVRAVFEAVTPIISAVGHAGNSSLTDDAADAFAITPTQAAEMAISDVMSTIRQIGEYERIMQRYMQNKLETTRLSLDRYRAHLEKLNPIRVLHDKMQKLDNMENSLKALMDNRLRTAKHDADMYTARLHGLSPTAKLTGGFGYIEKKANDEPLRFSKDAREGDELKIVLSDGSVHANVTKVEGKTE